MVSVTRTTSGAADHYRHRFSSEIYEADGQILKVDEVGRARTPREKQEEMLDDYERSGMTGMQFAKFARVKYPTLMYWVRRRRREREESASPVTGPQWLEAAVRSEEREGLLVEAPGGLRLIVKEGSPVKMAGEFLRGVGFGQPCLSFAGSLRVFVSLEACDMRKGFEGLSGSWKSVLRHSPRNLRLRGSPAAMNMVGRLYG